MGKYIDVLYQQWERVYYDNETDIQPVIDKLKEGAHPIEMWGNGMPIIQNKRTLVETEEYITPDKNNGYSTIEVYDEEQEQSGPIWKNGN